MRPLGGLLLAAFVVLLLRSTALSGLAAHGVTLDALAFATVVWALRHGDAWGSTFGFAVGLAADLDAGHWLGRQALGLSLLGYALGRLSHTLVRDDARSQFVMLAAATALHQLWLSVFELGALEGVPYLLLRTLIATLATALVGTLLLVLTSGAVSRGRYAHASRTSSAS